MTDTVKDTAYDDIAKLVPDTAFDASSRVAATHQENAAYYSGYAFWGQSSV